jgi:hypothetical protein
VFGHALVDRQLDALRALPYEELERRYLRCREQARVATDARGRRYEIEVSAERDAMQPGALRLVVAARDLPRRRRTRAAGIVVHREHGVIAEVSLLPFRARRAPLTTPVS